MAIFFVFLAITGIMLNHTDALNLDRRYLASDWLLEWYGIEPDVSSVNFALTDERWLTGTAVSLYLDGRFVAATNEKPVGVAETRDMFVIATENEILLLTSDGKLLERGAANTIPGHIERLGVTVDGLAVVETSVGRFLADRNLLEWRPSQAPGTWSQTAAAPAHLLEKVKKAERNRILSLERLLFDLHSGRLLGKWGPYFMDGVAVLLLILVGMGLYMSFSKRDE